jgi:hypothetical protein
MTGGQENKKRMKGGLLRGGQRFDERGYKEPDAPS